MKRLIALISLLYTVSPAVAELALQLPGTASETFSKTEPFASYKMPIGPFTYGPLPTVVAEGRLIQKAWRVDTSGGTTLGVMDNLRQQVERSGFELLYECETRECGGFDFRFGTDVLPEPSMHIDLGDFRYLSAQRLGQSVPEYLSLFVSRSGDVSYVQMIIVGGDEDEPLQIESGKPFPAPDSTFVPAKAGSILDALERNGKTVLGDLQFESGSSELGEGEYASLVELAGYLIANPETRVVLVGHTDFSGSLDANINLSRKRAQSVADRLVSLDVPKEQVEADGVGYLAPRSSNNTEQGRTLNRRVEAVLINGG